MLRKGLMLLGAGLVLNVTGCAVLSLLMVPFEFLLTVMGVVWDGVDSAVDAVVVVEPVEGPAPVVERLADGRFHVGEIAPGAHFDIVCEMPGFEPRRFRFPDDAGEIVTRPGGGSELTCLLVPESRPGGLAVSPR